MIEWSKLTDPEIDALDRQLPVLIPVGLIEAHGPHLESGFDAYSAEYIARALCAATGAILAPTLPYGYADTNWEYASTLGVRAETLGAVIGDLCTILCAHGFKKVIILSGHGANGAGCTLGFERAWQRFPDLKPAHWVYFTAGGVPMSHADSGETSLALAMDAVVHMDRARDFKVNKPWHEVHSRYRLMPDSGGVNGEATKATLALGEEIKAKILGVLTERLRAVMADRS